MAHPVREYVRRISSQNLEQYPEWDLTRPLPKLPVPDLKQTLKRYLDLVCPVVSLEDYERTKDLAIEFGKPGGIGEILQAKLLENSKIKENWVADLWLEDMYLKNSLPLPINSSPGMVFPRQHFQSEREQLSFAVAKFKYLGYEVPTHGMSPTYYQFLKTLYQMSTKSTVSSKKF